jgi:hypothetical protein
VTIVETLGTLDLADMAGCSEMDIRRMLDARMLPEPNRIGPMSSNARHSRHHRRLEWSPADARVVTAIAAINTLVSKTIRRADVLGIDWPALDALIRSHDAAGWLVIDQDGVLRYTSSAKEAVEWQCSSLLAVCVAVDAA